MRALAEVEPRHEPARPLAGRSAAPRPALVAVLGVAVYIAILSLRLATGGDLRDRIQIGPPLISQSHAGSTIRIDPRYHNPATGHGYDGQFYYYIALDPLNARFYSDWNSFGRDAAAYRYGRILYPVLARALALGRAPWVPATLLLVNLLGVGLGTLVVGDWLRRFDLSPWPALLYSLYPGVAVGVLRDLADPLAFSLVAAGVSLLHHAGRHRLAWAGVVFALGGLARETVLIAPLIYSLWFLCRREVRSGVALGLMSTVPVVVWRGWLVLWLGSPGMPGKVAPVFPFAGLFDHWAGDRPIQLLAVVIPALLLGVLSARAWAHGARSPEMLALAANILLLVIMLNPSSYDDLRASARIATGVPLFALLSLPSLLTALRRPTLTVLAACSALWAGGLAVALVITW